MRLTFTVAPIAFGLDNFSNIMVHWPNYLAPWINNMMPGTGQQFMYFVGATEILAGVIVAIKPRYGAYVVAGWLAGIIINLLTYSGFYDARLGPATTMRSLAACLAILADRQRMRRIAGHLGTGHYVAHPEATAAPQGTAAQRGATGAEPPDGAQPFGPARRRPIRPASRAASRPSASSSSPEAVRARTLLQRATCR